MVSYHPLTDSFTAATTERVLGALSGTGRHELRHLALGEHDDAPEIASATADLRWCDAVVFVYPTWWSGQPARLTGWLQAVVGERDLAPRRRRSARPLRNIHRIAAVTSHGSSKLVNVVQGEGGKRVLSRALRRRCHPLARFSWIALYAIDRSSSEDRQQFLVSIDRRLGAW